ncbi:MAG: hypothetical protein L3K15_03605 [Thermoplasmata archaeon]|nr:hypothetical protein [Thermoplasmata archaeon]
MVVAVYLTEDLHSELRSTAERERRSVSMQALLYIERGLHGEAGPLGGAAPSRSGRSSR